MLQFQVLLTPVVAMMGLAFMLNVMLRKFHETWSEQYVFGLMFGAIMVLGMTYPISLGEGLIFDTRTLLLAAAVVFVGPTAGFIAMLCGMICRVVIGGSGMIAGLVGLGLAFCLATIWYYFIRSHFKNRPLADASFGLFITSSIVALFVLPREIATALFFQIAPVLAICNALGMVAIGWVFRREIDLWQQSKILEEQAKRDPLTNLLNRRGLDMQMERARFDAKCGHAMFYFDIDNFKTINDTHGHDAGDAALAIIAARIKENLRSDAIFARHGGDEFSIYMPSVKEGDVKTVANRLGNLISKDLFEHQGATFATTISIGGYWTKSATPMNIMLDRADAQLLLAKQAGKNRSQIQYDRPNQLSSVA